MRQRLDLFYFKIWGIPIKKNTNVILIHFFTCILFDLYETIFLVPVTTNDVIPLSLYSLKLFTPEELHNNVGETSSKKIKCVSNLYIQLFCLTYWPFLLAEYCFISSSPDKIFF